jgi:hypothetical protein
MTSRGVLHLQRDHHPVVMTRVGWNDSVEQSFDLVTVKFAELFQSRTSSGSENRCLLFHCDAACAQSLSETVLESDPTNIE